VKDCRKADGTLFSSVEITRTVFGYTGARSEIIHWKRVRDDRVDVHDRLRHQRGELQGRHHADPYTVRIAQQNFMARPRTVPRVLGAYERYGCGSARQSGTNRIYYACLFANGGTSKSILPAPSPTTAPRAHARADDGARRNADPGTDDRDGPPAARV